MLQDTGVDGLELIFANPHEMDVTGASIEDDQIAVAEKSRPSCFSQCEIERRLFKSPVADFSLRQRGGERIRAV